MNECGQSITYKKSDKHLSHDAAPSDSREDWPAQPLEQLLAEITEGNLHEEIDFGLTVGNEIW